MVTAANIVKTYGKKKELTALNDISFTVQPGELFGIIGPDGAGKTSLFRIFTTLLLADSGSATVDGLDVVKQYRDIRKRVGYMPGRFSLYPDLTVEENLNFFATVFNTRVRDQYDLIKDIYVQIEPFKKRPAGKLSGGMKQKLALSCALIHRPSVLFLDEPTTGVDAVSRKEFWDMLQRLKQQGITILVSTPYMDEAGRCGRVALMQTGRLLTVDTPQQITAGFGKTLAGARAPRMLQLLHSLRKLDMVESAYPSGVYHHVVLKNGFTTAALETAVLQQYGYGAEVVPVAPGIEDCFMQLMGTGAPAAASATPGLNSNTNKHE